MNLDLEELVAKVNSDIVGKVVNLASRSARFVETLGLSPSYPDDGGLFETGAKTGDEIAHAYEQCDYARAMRAIMSLADRANEYVDRKEPWKLAKHPERSDELRDVCTVILNLYRQLAIYLAPVLPRLATQSAELLGVPLDDWALAKKPEVGKPIGRFQHLMQRVDPKKVEALLSAHREPTESAANTARSGDVEKQAKVSAPAGGEALAEQSGAGPAGDGAALAAEPLAPECTIDDFAKVDLRVARVVAAEEVPEAKKLVKLTVSFGGDATRTVFAGIKAAYKPADLVGRLVVVVANLAPRKMKLGTSEGMVIAAGPGEKEVFLLAPDSGAKPGQRVH
jgi:methionyl-tRNA synthetase